MELGEYFRFLLALGFVLVLIAGLAALLRRSGFGDRLAIAPAAGGERRLALVEVRPLDAKRKLVLLRRDDREHLVLLGIGGDLLIESDIPAPPVRPAATAEAAGAAAATPPEGLVGRVMGRLRGQPT
jgi:flagellar protein FliO/FliZ